MKQTQPGGTVGNLLQAKNKLRKKVKKHARKYGMSHQPEKLDENSPEGRMQMVRTIGKGSTQMDAGGGV